MSDEPRVGAPSTHNHLLLIEPDELIFTNVKLKQTYSQCVRITNPLTVPVEFTLRAGSPIRYKISPSQVSLKGGETVLVEIRLRVLTHTKPKALFSLGGADTAGSAEHERGIKDIFHIRSDFFTQKFHATWYAWSGTTAAPLPAGASAVGAAAGQTAHDLPDSSMTAYAREGGAAGMRAQRVDEAAEARKADRARSRERAKQQEAQQAKEQAQQAKEQAKEQAEAELHRPFERTSLTNARKAASHMDLLPPSAHGMIGSPSASPTSAASAPSTSAHSRAPSSRPAPASAAASAASSSSDGQDYLSLSQSHRNVSSALDRKTQEVQQWELNYAQLEREYKLVVGQLESTQAQLAASQQAQPELQAQLADMMAAERAEVEHKNQRVLALLLSKDEALREKDAEIEQLASQMEEYAQSVGELEEQLAQQRSDQRQIQSNMQARIDELTDALAAAQSDAAASVAQASAAAQAASAKDHASIQSLLAKQEELISERDASESNASALRSKVGALEQQLREAHVATRKAQEKADTLAARLREVESHAAAEVNGATQARQQEQIEELLRENHELREAKESASGGAAVAGFGSNVAGPVAQQQWAAEREELSNLVVELQQQSEAHANQLRQAQSEYGRQIANLQRQLADAQVQADAVSVKTHAAPSSSSLSPPGSPIAASTAAQQLASNSQVLAAKQREVEELRRTNAELQAALRDAEQVAQRASSGASTPPASVAATIDSLRAQLLLVESELSSKAHSLQQLQLSKRDLEARLAESERACEQARSHAQDAESRYEDAHRKWLAASAAQEERDVALQQLADSEARLASLSAREAEAVRASAEMEARLEASAKETEAFYQREIGNLKTMMQSMIKQTQQACVSGSSHPATAAAASNPALQSSVLSSLDASALLSDFHSVLSSLSALSASRDSHKLSSVRSSKRIQALERQIDDLHAAAREAAERAAVLAEEHAQEMEAAEKKDQAARETLEQRLDESAQEVSRLQHSIAQLEAKSAKDEQAIDALQSSLDASSLQLKKAHLDSKSLSRQHALELEDARLELAKSVSAVSEKSAQVRVLMETVEALQQGAFQVEKEREEAAARRDDDESSSTSSHAHSALSAQLISFAAQLSHARSQESLLRRSLQTLESQLASSLSGAKALTEEVDHLVHQLVPELERQVAGAVAKEKAAKAELAKVAGKLGQKTEEAASAHARLEKCKANQSILQSQIDALQGEIKAARKRHIDAMQQAQEEQNRALRDFAEHHASSSSSSSTGSSTTVSYSKHTGMGLASTSQHHLGGAALLAAVKELSASIAQASSATTLPINAQLFSPFTPPKKRRSASSSSSSSSSTSSQASSVIVSSALGSPQFVLGSPSRAASATVGSSSSAGLASSASSPLPAIFERVLNLLLENENALRHSERTVSLLHFQMGRMAATVRQGENETDALKSKVSLYATQHERILSTLKCQTEQSNSALLSAQRGAEARLEELRGELFQARTALHAIQAEREVADKATNKLQAELARMRRKMEVERQEHAHELLRIDSPATGSSESTRDARWREREESLKQYVEHVIRPILLNGSDGDHATSSFSSSPSSSAAPPALSHISSLAAALTSLKLLESTVLADNEKLRRGHSMLLEQVAGWKEAFGGAERKRKEEGAKYVERGGDEGGNNKGSGHSRRREEHASSPRSSRAHRSRSPAARDDFDPSASASSRLSRPRSLSPAPPSSSALHSLREEVVQLQERESRLLTQLRKSTAVQQQLEETIEQLLGAQRDWERQAEEEAVARERQEERAEMLQAEEAMWQREEEEREARERKGRSGALSSSMSRATVSSAAKHPRGLSASTRASAPSSGRGTTFAPPKPPARPSARADVSECAMSNSLARTVLQVSKQLRERDRAAEERHVELTKVQAQLAQVREQAAAMQAQLRQRQQEVSVLQAQMNHREVELSGRQSLLQQSESRCAQLASQVSNLEASNQHLTSQLSSLTASSTASSGKLAQELLKAQQDILPVTVENASLKSQLASLQQQLAHSLSLENTERSRNLELVAQVKSMEESRATAQSAAAAQALEVKTVQESLERCRAEGRKERSRLEEELRASEDEKREVRHMLRSLEHTRSELSLQYEHLRRESSLHEADRSARMGELEAQLREAIQERQGAQRREADLAERIEVLERERQELTDSAAAAESRYRSELAQMQEAHALLESTLSTCSSELKSFVSLQSEHAATQHELKALRAQHMDLLEDMSREREERSRRTQDLEEELSAAQSTVAKQSSQLGDEIAHQKSLYNDIILKLRARVQQLVQEQEESDQEAVALERKLAEVTDLNVANASARVRAEEERDLAVSRLHAAEAARETALLEAESKGAVEAQIAGQDFRNLQANMEEFRRKHEALVAVYEGQHTRLLGRLRKALETVQELQQEKRDTKEKKPESSSGRDGRKVEGRSDRSAPVVPLSDAAKSRLVFDMTELLSNLAEREAMVRSLTAEVDSYKRALSMQGSAAPSIARPLNAILNTSTQAFTNGVAKASKGRASAHQAGGGKENMHVDDLAPSAAAAAAAPLSWTEERSLAVLGSELAHMEVQLKHAQRLHLNEQENSAHLEAQLASTESQLQACKEKLRASHKELQSLHRATAGTIKAQEAELVKITDSLRSEEEWASLTRAVAEGKSALKHAKEDMARRAKQMAQTNDEVARLRSQCQELDSSLSARDARLAKLSRTITAKDVLIADLKRRFEEAEAEDRQAAEGSQQLAEKLRAALSASARKDALVRELKSKLEQAEKDVLVSTAQAAELSSLQSKLRHVQKELSQTQREVEQLQEEKEGLERRRNEMQDQMELLKTKAHIQTQGQKNDLASLEREAARIGSAYDTLRALVREVALAQVHAIDKLSRTLADLDRDRDTSSATDGELSMQDVHAMGIAAEFSKDDLEDIISTTLRIDSSRASPSTRTAAYARRLFADLEQHLSRDLSSPPTLASVRQHLLQLLDERVRMELLVLQAATAPAAEASMADASRAEESRGRYRPAAATSAPRRSPSRPAAPASSHGSTDASLSTASLSLSSRHGASAFSTGSHTRTHAPSTRAGRSQESVSSLAARARQARGAYDRSRSVSPAPSLSRGDRVDSSLSSLSSISRG